ncbi:MAG TPA: CDP-alcohol phosphatidyltransferase family protein [Solirubrobacteraceae bacterium]|nr:CDP-alcohol phosphatidyltransferase family protein [Solirubrobacteraceae bacterium]
MLLATAPAADGGPAALLPWEGGTVLARLVEQVTALGVPRAVVITRPAWEGDVRAAVGQTGAVAIEASAGVPDDLRAIGQLAAGEGDGGLVVMYGDIVTHTQALAGLLADPRVATGILVGGKRSQLIFKIAARRGRVTSAASPYHAVHRPTTAFLGALKVAPSDLAALGRVAERLRPLAADLPATWEAELRRKRDNWRIALWRSAQVEEEPSGEAEAAEPPVEEEPAPLDPATLELSDVDEAHLAHRVAAAPDDTAALLLVGLVRDGAHISMSYVRRLYWSRPLSTDDAALAEQEIAEIDEDRVLLDSAVKGADGFFTTFFVSPYSRFIARWAAHRGLTPNQVTTASVFIGLLAAIAFATGERWGLITGAVLLQVAFTTDCVDGQLARYTRTFSKLGAWLDSVFDRTKEYLAFAGLAIGASQMDDPVWLLACAAITLQTARHMSDFSFGGTQQQVLAATVQPPLEQARDAAGAAAEARRNALEVDPAAAPPPKPLPQRVLSAWHVIDRWPGVRWAKKMIAFPIGERFATISLTAALWTPRTTFIVLLAWGGLAAVYTQTGRVLRSLR